MTDFAEKRRSISGRPFSVISVTLNLINLHLFISMDWSGIGPVPLLQPQGQRTCTMRGAPIIRAVIHQNRRVEVLGQHGTLGDGFPLSRDPSAPPVPRELLMPPTSCRLVCGGIRPKF
jgi:hypothetical protein